MYEKFYLEFTIFWTAMGLMFLHMQILSLRSGVTYFYRIIEKAKEPKIYWLVQMLWLILTLGCFSLLIDWLTYY